MKTIIHVNQHRIKANRKDGGERSVLTCKTYKENRYGHTAIIRGEDGRELGRFVYRPEKPLSCGAHVWFETNETVEVLTVPARHYEERRPDAGQDKVPAPPKAQAEFASSPVSSPAANESGDT